MASQPGKWTIAIHIAKAKFGQLVEYNMEIIFLEKSCNAFTSYKAFLKKAK